ncbi:Ku protein, partial [Delftia tsuruhatensis]
MTRKATSPRTAPAVSSRSLWKGAISFGLVHIPIGLYAATASTDIDFDWLDKRNMQPVGYKRINKVTGKEVASADIVKGVEFEEGRYVVLSAEEIAAAFPKTTQTIEIEAFVDADDIPFIYLERPYYTAPLHRGGKVYALLREALRKSNKVGVAKVVIQAKQHLAILIPCGRALVLNLLRWGGEIRSFEQLDLPPLDARAAGIKAAEMTMALALIKDMSQA